MNYLFFILFFLGTGIYAYDLNNYKHADFSRSSLHISPSLVGNYNNSYTPEIFNTYERNRANNNTLTLNTQYSHSQFSQDHVFNIDFSLYTTLSLMDTYKRNQNYSDNYFIETDESESRNAKGYTIVLISSGTNDIYFHNDLYLSVTHAVSLFSSYNDLESTDKNHSFQTTEVNSSNLESRNFHGLLGAGIGYGRVYEVQDAHTAQYILSELQDAQLLSEPITTTAIEALAKIITSFSKKRFYDSRDHRKYQLKTIDSFFKQHNLINEPSVDYFAIINDYLGITYPERFSGTKLSFDILGSTGSNTMIFASDNTDEYEYRHASLFAQVQYKMYRALNTLWQLDNESTLKAGGYRFGIHNSFSHKPGADYIFNQGGTASLGHLIRLNFYPTSRTKISNSINAQYWYSIGEYIPEEAIMAIPYTNHFTSVDVTSAVTWYLSNRINITTDVGITFQNEIHTTDTESGTITFEQRLAQPTYIFEDYYSMANYETSHNFSLHYSLSLSYAIF